MPKYSLPEGAGIPGGPRRFSQFAPVGQGGQVGGHGRTQSTSDLPMTDQVSLASGETNEDTLNSSEEEEGGPLGSLAARSRRRRVIRCSNRSAFSAGENSDLSGPEASTSAQPEQQQQSCLG